MAIQIFNDGACIRIEKGTKTLLVTKDQVKTIDIVHDNIVRIDIGEGPLKNILLNHQDVSAPEVDSANALRDLIKGMLLTDQYDGGDATEQGQVNILNQLTTITGVLESLVMRENDFTKNDPTRTDESNPNMVYRGWHKLTGLPSGTEWAIQRIRREDDIIIYEWASGNRQQTHRWDEREMLTYTAEDNTGDTIR